MGTLSLELTRAKSRAESVRVPRPSFGDETKIASCALGRLSSHSCYS